MAVHISSAVNSEVLYVSAEAAVYASAHAVAHSPGTVTTEGIPRKIIRLYRFLAVMLEKPIMLQSRSGNPTKGRFRPGLIHTGTVPVTIACPYSNPTFPGVPGMRA